MLSSWEVRHRRFMIRDMEDNDSILELTEHLRGSIERGMKNNHLALNRPLEWVETSTQTTGMEITYVLGGCVIWSLCCLGH